MTDILKQLARLGSLHQSIADDVYPRGATLSCATCGTKQVVLATDCARYLARGWPQCHGRSVTVEAIK